MKKTLLVGAALLTLAACKKETEVKTENTVIETATDTVSIDTDTITANETSEVTEQKEVVEAPEAVEKPEVKEKKETASKPEIAVKVAKDVKVDYASFGDKILADKALSKEQMFAKYKGLKPGDSVSIKFATKIKDVCQKKGCWMSLQLPDEKESFVKFKDYAFFVPLNAAGQDAVVSGKAFVSEISVAQLRHYAKDGGKTEEEINKITEPKKTYGFIADGVLISK
ncbi:DUF4920 domain-containing protein [Flavobacterium sp. Sd200]|uniref:DUF4920 domain-containing protein n=1 Tax=Flavobacterium sp. Sd200 TaxID=2692211 RepID=UPI00136822A0|nr:DUF4920 domain-containing protein [Flavobacterium sp. Sd200]MXN90207.1 DUF4920 domain-containing protein [Flavobacterium sp. Sd200]